MDDVRGRFLGLSHGTTPTAVTTNMLALYAPHFATIVYFSVNNGSGEAGAISCVPLSPKGGDGCIKRTMAEGEISLETMSVSLFLANMGLEQLRDIFEQEQITMDILVKMTNDELKGIGINAFGPRKKIVNGVEKLLSRKGNVMCSTSASVNLPDLVSVPGVVSLTSVKVLEGRSDKTLVQKNSSLVKNTSLFIITFDNSSRNIHLFVLVYSKADNVTLLNKVDLILEVISYGTI